VRHLFVYYRIDPTQAAAAARAVDALLVQLAPYCDTPPRRLARCDEPELWMEVYEGIVDFASFARQLDEAVRVLDCHRFIEGERHLESFCVPQPPHRQQPSC
jgi:hypothetical protein